MSKKSVAVRIAGHQYKIRSDGDPSALQDIARYVDKAMDRVRARTGTVDTLDVSVLTCLNLAREIITLRESQNGAVGDERMRSLIERVEMVLDGDYEPIVERDDQTTAASKGDGQTRTLELPSVEVLRDRTAAALAGSGAGVSATATNSEMPEMPETRAAAGGRERAS